MKYNNGQGVAQNDKVAVKWYTIAEEQGHAGSQDNLGRMFFLGRGVRPDRSEAFKWIIRSADEGYPAAQETLGLIILIASEWIAGYALRGSVVGRFWP